MTPKEKKAFVARMKKGKREAAKGKSKSKGGGKKKDMVIGVDYYKSFSDTFGTKKKSKKKK